MVQGAAGRECGGREPVLHPAAEDGGQGGGCSLLQQARHSRSQPRVKTLNQKIREMNYQKSLEIPKLYL